MDMKDKMKRRAWRSMHGFSEELFKPKPEGARHLSAWEKDRLMAAFCAINFSGEQYERELRERLVHALIHSTILSVTEVPPGLTNIHLYGGQSIIVCPDD